MARVTELLSGLLEGVPADLKPGDLYTNEFIDPTIGFD